jgi:hypothetical protein
MWGGYELIRNEHRPSFEVPLFLSDYNESWNFSTNLKKGLKSVQVFHAQKEAVRRNDIHNEANTRFFFAILRLFQPNIKYIIKPKIPLANAMILMLVS